MAILGRKFRWAAGTAIVCIAMAGCGGSDRADPVAGGVAPPVVIAPPDEPVIPETIEGVATPSSVSVVTATNAT
jgi:hypothetical protein